MIAIFKELIVSLKFERLNVNFCAALIYRIIYYINFHEYAMRTALSFLYICKWCTEYMNYRRLQSVCNTFFVLPIQLIIFIKKNENY